MLRRLLLAEWDQACGARRHFSSLGIRAVLDAAIWSLVVPAVGLAPSSSWGSGQGPTHLTAGSRRGSAQRVRGRVAAGAHAHGRLRLESRSLRESSALPSQPVERVARGRGPPPTASVMSCSTGSTMGSRAIQLAVAQARLTCSRLRPMAAMPAALCVPHR